MFQDLTGNVLCHFQKYHGEDHIDCILIYQNLKIKHTGLENPSFAHQNPPQSPFKKGGSFGGPPYEREKIWRAPYEREKFWGTPYVRGKIWRAPYEREKFWRMLW
jgi:hypothetical protein